MKVLVICALVTVCLGLDLDLEWKSYKEQFNKWYTNKREDEFRKIIFKKKFLEHIKHNELYATGKVSYEVGVNQFTDWTEEEFRKLTPPMKNYKSRNDVPRFEYDSSIEVPDSFDWRQKGAVTRVKSQGFCGSCYAFASTGAMEGAYFIKNNKSIDISEQNLVDCSDHGNLGCNGGQMRACFQYVIENGGLDTQTAYPYQGYEQDCSYNSSAKCITLSGYVSVVGEEDLKQAVALKGPVAVGISAEHLQWYSKGILDKPCEATEADHAVLVVGYGSENGTDYWIIKNSWSLLWGEKGYFRMARNRNLCLITDDASYPVM